MSRTAFRQYLRDLDLSARPDERIYRERMIALLDGAPDCFHRHCFPGHFTGSAMVVSADLSRALLHHHRNLDRWLQFGGHCDGDDDLPRVAAREALEESGIESLALASAEPLDLDIHAIPANPRKGEPAHEHYDVRYLFVAPANAVAQLSEESHALQWLSAEEALALPLDPGLRRLIAKWQTLATQRAATIA